MKKYLYMQVYQAILEQIESGALKPGDRLLTETELCTEYDVSRDTVRKALSKLETDGLIERTAALGTFIKQTKKDYPLARIESFSEQMIKMGATPSSEITLLQLLEDIRPEIRKILNLSKSEKCYKLCRIRKADNQPMAYEISYIRHKYCPELLTHLDNYASVYHILSDIYALDLAYEDISLEAKIPSPEISKYLNIPADSATLKMHCILKTSDDEPVYYVKCYYRGDKYVFTTTIKW